MVTKMIKTNRTMKLKVSGQWVVYKANTEVKSSVLDENKQLPSSWLTEEKEVPAKKPVKPKTTKPAPSKEESK